MGAFATKTPAAPVWRVGRAPSPWAWVDWKWADGGTFPGRWDAPNRTYRTTYAASSAYAALVEVLAQFRPDPELHEALAGIDEDEVDALYPTVSAGTISASWFHARRLARARLLGVYCDVSAAATIAELRPRFLGAARSAGLPDFDAAALQIAERRALTQQVGLAVYTETDAAANPTFDGVRFLSRHGSDLELWTVFERSTDGERSALLRDVEVGPLTSHHPDVVAAMTLHGLTLDD